MVQNLAAYLILYAITIKWIMCVQKKMEVSGLPQRPMLISTNILRNLSLATKTKQQHEIANKFSGVAKSWHVVVVVVVVVVVGKCHPMPPYGYGPK